jgi:hypothetical protein
MPSPLQACTLSRHFLLALLLSLLSRGVVANTYEALCAEAERTGSATTLRACETLKSLRGSRAAASGGAGGGAGGAGSAASRGPSPRVDAVKEAIAWAFDGYETFAWGRDELKPLSRGGMDSARSRSPPNASSPRARLRAYARRLSFAPAVLR